MPVYAKIENNKLITAYNGYNGIIGLADSPELCLANGFTAYEEDENGLTLVDKYFMGSYEIQDGVLTDITNTVNYKQNIYNNKVQREINSYYEYLYRNDGSGCGAGAVTRLQGANALGATAIATKLTNEIQARHQTLVTNCNAIVKE